MKFAVIDQADATPVETAAAGGVDIILHDGTRLQGAIGGVAAGQDPLAVLNDPAGFFPLRLDNGERLLVAKAAVAICRPLDKTAG